MAEATKAIARAVAVCSILGCCMPFVPESKAAEAEPEIQESRMSRFLPEHVDPGLRRWIGRYATFPADLKGYPASDYEGVIEHFIDWSKRVLSLRWIPSEDFIRNNVLLAPASAFKQPTELAVWGKIKEDVVFLRYRRGDQDILITQTWGDYTGRFMFLVVSAQDLGSKDRVTYAKVTSPELQEESDAKGVVWIEAGRMVCLLVNTRQYLHSGSNLLRARPIPPNAWFQTYSTEAIRERAARGTERTRETRGGALRERGALQGRPEVQDEEVRAAIGRLPASRRAITARRYERLLTAIRASSADRRREELQMRLAQLIDEIRILSGGAREREPAREHAEEHR